LTLICLAITTFSLCYLAADARIFGADTTAWNEVYNEVPLAEEDKHWLWGLGILKIRQSVLHWDLIREHLSCYFCMGIWAGPLAHVLLWNFYQLNPDASVAYCLQHPNTPYWWTLGLTCAFLWGAGSSYFINAVLHRIEGD